MYPNMHHKHTSSGSRSHFNHSYSKPNVGQHYEKSDIEMLTERMGFQCLLERNIDIKITMARIFACFHQQKTQSTQFFLCWVAYGVP